MSALRLSSRVKPAAYILKNHETEVKPETDEKAIDIDEALETGGPCGKFQLLVQMLFMYLVLSIGYQVVFTYFIANDPPWSCVANNTNSSFCNEHIGDIFTSDSDHFYKRCNLERKEWQYTTKKDYSFVTEYDLVCDKATMAAFASSVFYIGGLVGSVISGIVADAYGRKIVLIVSLTITIISSICCSYTKSILQLTLVRGLLGSAQMTCYSIAFIILSEFIAPSYRTISANMFQLTLCMSQVCVDFAAYFERSWRDLQIYAALPSSLALLFFFLLPESPRWLLSVNRKEEAERSLEKINKMNGKQMIIRLKVPDVQQEKMYTYVDLFRSWKLTFLTLSQGMIWATVALVYYAIALESSNLGGNMYQAFALSALADLPSNFAAFWACNYLGRKKAVLGSLFFSGLFISSIALIPHHVAYKYVLNITLVMISKFMIDLAFNGIFIWTFELYPTCLRSQGWAVCVVFERVGALVVPFLTTVLQSISAILPFIIMGVIAVLAAFCGLILPETNKQPTRETYDDFFRDNISESSFSDGIVNELDSEEDEKIPVGEKKANIA